MFRFFSSSVLGVLACNTLHSSTAFAKMRSFTIVPEESDIRFLVFSEGFTPITSLFAHNHVIVSKQCKGDIIYDTRGKRSSLFVSAPVSTLIVDDSKYRAEENQEFFNSKPTQFTINATRANMFRKSMLYASKYHECSVRTTKIIRVSKNQVIMHCEVTIRDVTRSMEIPAEMTIRDNQILLSGNINILGSDFNIIPFSFGFGMMKTKDEMNAKFNLIAVSNKNTH